MSSNEDEGDGSSHVQNAKKRRIQRACDICRRKKIRCDGGQMPGNRCSNCIAYSFDCTYVEAARKRGPPKGYVESLEHRLEKMERLLRRLYPDGDFTKDLENLLEYDGIAIMGDGLAPSSRMSPDPNALCQPKTAAEIASNVIRSVGEPVTIPDDEEDLGHVILAEDIQGLALDEKMKNRFFGKSSGAMLLQAAIDLKREYTGQPKERIFSNADILAHRRDEYWSRQSWDPLITEGPESEYKFPDADLMPSLIDNYFKYYNLYFPLLHRPTFERSIADGLHLTHDTFAAVVLLVCANGARYSDDPRVLLEGTDSQHSCGWKWFTQVQMVRKSLLSPPTLYDLQFYCLTVQFLQGSSAPHACWIMVGIGVRLAQDVGAHRRKVHTHKLSIEDELWKRAFWVLVSMDRLISTVLGRPCAIQDEDFDLDLPIEVDDEYWEHSDPEQAFKQPPNKPSLVTFFNCYLRLNQVLGIALRTIYSINKSKILLGFVGNQWEQHIVAELDSALNKWVDSVPDHLRWDPNREDPVFFNQSAILYSHYYHLQILIHRPFIRKPSPLSFPSMAICTNAARTCSHIVDIQRRKSPIPQPQSMTAAFTAGIVLLLNIWAGKRSGLATDPQKEMADVHKCMRVLRSNERRWPTAGRLWDILYELANVGDLPLPQPSPAPNKRERDSDSPASSTNTEDIQPISTPPTVPRHVAGSRRVSGKEAVHATSSIQLGRAQPDPSHLTGTNLPIHSEELGRLPLHGQMDFVNTGASGSGVQGNDINTSNYWYPPPLAGHLTPHALPSSSMSHGAGVPQGELSLTDQALYDQLLTTMGAPYSQQYQQYVTGSMTSPIMATGSSRPMDGLDSQSLQNVGSIPPQMVFDNDTIAMWTNAPAGFELDDWGQYLSNVSELTHGIHNPTDGAPR